MGGLFEQKLEVQSSVRSGESPLTELERSDLIYEYEYTFREVDDVWRVSCLL